MLKDKISQEFTILSADVMHKLRCMNNINVILYYLKYLSIVLGFIIMFYASCGIYLYILSCHCYLINNYHKRLMI